MKISFGMYWQAYGRQQWEVPDGSTEEEAIQYILRDWGDIPLPTDSDYVSGSDELDYESIEIEE